MKKSIFSFIFIFFLLFTIFSKPNPKNVAIIGTGYVGLIAGGGLADIGHTITCVDIDKRKIDMLNAGEMPIYEPGLGDLINKNIQRITFTTDTKSAVKSSEIIIIAVGTPTKKDFSSDLRALYDVAKSIGDILVSLDDYKVICIKSTVPVGTNEKIKEFLVNVCGVEEKKFDLVSNPEFLRAGSALKDFFEKNPVVLGSDSEKALSIMEELFSPLLERDIEIIKTNFPTAETIKYAWNSFSTIRIGYVNELSRFCNACGADIFTVVKGMSFSEKLLPSYKLKPGPGIGGSCLPKDASAFVKIAEEYGITLRFVKAFIKSNEEHKIYIVNKLYSLMGRDLKGKTVCLLGLSFKPNTDDIRKSPAIDVIGKLIEYGANIKAYDPQAMDNMKKVFSNVQYCNSSQEAILDSDAVVILTDWAEFKSMDLKDIIGLMKGEVFVDTRNIYSINMASKSGIKYFNLGRR